MIVPSHAAVERIPGGYLVLAVTNGSVVELSESAFEIWQLMLVRAESNYVTQQLVERHGAGEQEVAAFVRDAARTLHDAGLLLENGGD